MEVELLDAEATIRAAPGVQLEERGQHALADLPRRDPLEAHALPRQAAREAPQLAQEAGGGAAGRGADRQLQTRARGALDHARPGGQEPGRRSDVRAPQQQRRTRCLASKPGARRVGPLARHEPAAVIRRPGAAAGVHVHGHRHAEAPVQALAVEAQGHQRFHPARSRAPGRHPSGRAAGERRPPCLDPIRGLEVRGALHGSPRDRASRGAAQTERTSSSGSTTSKEPAALTAGFRPAACVVPRAAFPRARSSRPSRGRRARRRPGRAARGAAFAAAG